MPKYVYKSLKKCNIYKISSSYIKTCICYEKSPTITRFYDLYEKLHYEWIIDGFLKHYNYHFADTMLDYDDDFNELTILYENNRYSTKNMVVKVREGYVEAILNKKVKLDINLFIFKKGVCSKLIGDILKVTDKLSVSINSHMLINPSCLNIFSSIFILSYLNTIITSNSTFTIINCGCSSCRCTTPHFSIPLNYKITIYRFIRKIISTFI